MTVQILYFAWLRERIGLSEEAVTLPDTVKTVQHLVDWLRSRGPNFENALEDLSTIRIALDQDFAQLEDPLGHAREIALFPPVTGG